MKNTDDEEVTIEELSARYMRILAIDRRGGRGGVTPEDHFQLALLCMAAGKYSVIKGEYGQRYRIPSWSKFAENSIKALESSL